MVYTKEEIIEKFLGMIHAMGEDTNDNDLEQMAFNILSLIDGETLDLPKFFLRSKSGKVDITGELHSLLLRSNEELDKIWENKDINFDAACFIDFIREEVVKNSHSKQEVISKILQELDDNYVMYPDPNPEDKSYYLEKGENFYPEANEEFNICGQLAAEYKELYSGKAK